ncbi:MAG TPA: hypothetical protein VGK74_11195 [Symbiobacteriaceae bacterium]
MAGGEPPGVGAGAAGSAGGAGIAARAQPAGMTAISIAAIT